MAQVHAEPGSLTIQLTGDEALVLDAMLERCSSQTTRAGRTAPGGIWRIEQGSELVSASDYCLSYTAVVFTGRPWASFPVCLMARVLPSAETVALAVTVALPPFFQTFS